MLSWRRPATRKACSQCVVASLCRCDSSTVRHEFSQRIRMPDNLQSAVTSSFSLSRTSSIARDSRTMNPHHGCSPSSSVHLVREPPKRLTRLIHDDFVRLPHKHLTATSQAPHSHLTAHKNPESLIGSDRRFDISFTVDIAPANH
jgi:hypothetical protein